MSNYIEREALLRKIRWADTPEECVISARRMPAADVAPVVHGRWIEDHDYLKCPKCGAMVKRDFTFFDIGDWNYCPNCGAKREVADD